MSRRFEVAFENEQMTQTADEPLEIEKVISEENPTEDVAGDLDPIEFAQECLAIENELIEIANELSDNDRVIEVTDGLQDIATQVEHAPDAGVDIPMLQTAANMAVAGTDADAQSIIPSMESFKDKQVALEAIGEKIQSALNAVISSISKIGSKLGELIKNIFKNLKNYEASLKQQQEKLNASKGVEKFTFSGKSSSLIQAGKKTITTGKEYLASLSEAVDFFKKWTAVSVPSVEKFDNSVKEWYASAGRGDAFKATSTEAYNAYMTMVKTTAGLPNMTRIAQTASHETFVTGDMLCNVKLTVNIPRAWPEIWKDSNTLVGDVLRGTRAHLTNENPLINMSATEVEYSFSKAEISNIIKLGLEAVAECKRYMDGRYRSVAKSYMTARVLSLGLKQAETGLFMPLSTRIVNMGVNNATVYVKYSYKYGEKLVRSALMVAGKSIASAKAE